ncbi:hypothetical protein PAPPERLAPAPP_02310 [Brevundimonas phage vB_BpoS-Papperlapapp]|nr:hypothetical protein PAPPERLAPAPP_02310 [Brevundimonas phage vB_BpoS-Papperlapapp]
MSAPFISSTCEGETCRCGAPAVAKIGEEIQHDDPHPSRHNLTAYVCARHYALVLGPAAARQVGYAPAADKPDDTVIDRARLRRLRAAAQDAQELSPTPWQHTERTRTLYGNEAGYLADKNGDWIANFDGHEENAFAAEADPSVVMALVDLVEVMVSALEHGSMVKRPGAIRQISFALARKAGIDPNNWHNAALQPRETGSEIDFNAFRPGHEWFKAAAEDLYANLEIKLGDDYGS